MSHFRSSRVLPVLAAAAGLAAFPSLRAQQEPQVPERIQELEQTVGELQDQLVQERARLLESVEVNGTRLDPRAVKREAVYLTGGKLVDAKIADFFILEEMEKAIASGRDPEEFRVTDEDVMEELAGMKEKFAAEYPGVSFWDAVRSQYGLSKETFIQQRKQAILFDRVFFPGSVKNWPLITKEAIMAKTQGEHGRKFLEQLETATEGVDENGQPKQLPDFWVQMLRQFVQQGLRDWSDIQFGSDGLDPQYVISVNGRTWSTEEAFDFVKQGLFVQDLERAIQEVVIREALRQELSESTRFTGDPAKAMEVLRRKGFEKGAVDTSGDGEVSEAEVAAFAEANPGALSAYITDEEFEERFAEYRKPYDDTPFNIEVIATRFKGYPCLEAFRARWRLISSYQDMIADEITDESLQAHADEHAAFFANGEVSIDLIPFLGRDPDTAAWRPDGMAKAKERCEAVFEQLENEEISFDEALQEKGEFFAMDENKGRLGFKPLNQIRQQFRENEFTELLDGYSVAHYLFYDAPVGKAVGPLPGPDGYYIARVNARTPPRKKVDVSVERERQLVEEDYVYHRFKEWANEVLARTEIK